MEFYKRTSVQKVEQIPQCIPSDAVHIRVSASSKIKNTVDKSEALLRDQSIKVLVFNGIGQEIDKAFKFAETVKKHHKSKKLIQIVEIASQVYEEYWYSLEANLDGLKVTREIPMVYIILSKGPL